MPIRTKKHMEEVRESIMHALARCITRRGVGDTTIAHLIEESGLSAGAIYRHFKNKDDLLIGLVNHRIKAVDEKVLMQELGGFDFWRFVDWSLKRVITTDHVYLVDLEFLSLARVNAKVRAIYVASERAWVSIVKKCIRTLPDSQLLFDHPGILAVLIEGMRATGNQIILRRMIGMKIDERSCRQQIHMHVEGAFALAAKAAPAAKATRKRTGAAR
jgi:AcrR family transcriptional regulator